MYIIRSFAPNSRVNDVLRRIWDRVARTWQVIDDAEVNQHPLNVC